MKISDFTVTDFTYFEEIKLSEWVINGEHYPTVKIYQKHETNEFFQVSEKHKKYRKTPPTKDIYIVQQYGEWKNFE